MSNLSDMMSEWAKEKLDERRDWLEKKLRKHLLITSQQMDDSNVLMYFSAFLQRPERNDTQMKLEDINGIMATLYKMDPGKNLVVILHTPGGDLVAAEQMTNYIHSKFKKVTVIVPVMSMSAGTMFALSCDEIIISKAGQLGPIDPQIFLRQRVFSVKDIRAQFDLARKKILNNLDEAHVWLPILQSYGPALYTQAIQIEKYATTKVREWLKNKGKNERQIKSILHAFHTKPNFHGERIGYDIMSNSAMGLKVSLLENKQLLQNAVLQTYHAATILADVLPITKIIISHGGGPNNIWVKMVPQPGGSS